MASTKKALRIVALISMIASVAVIIVSSWTFASILVIDNNISKQNHITAADSEHEYHSDQQQTIERNNLWVKFNSMTENFKAMLLGCTWMTIIFGMVQLSTNLPLLMGSSKVLQNFSKYAVGLYSICILFMLGCFFAPLTNNRHCNEMDHMNMCSKYLTISELGQKIKVTFSTLPSNPVQFFRKDLTSYYLAVGLNIFVLIFDIVFLTCALQFGDGYASL